MKKLLFFLPIFLYISTFNCIARESLFDELERELFGRPGKMVKKMEKRIKQSMMHEPDECSLDTIRIEEDAQKGLTLIITGVSAENVSANLHESDNMLEIKAGNRTIQIKSQNTFVSVVSSCQAEQNKQENDGPAQFFYSYSSSQTTRKTEHPIDLEKQTIAYDPIKKELTILFEYQKEKKRKPVPVTIVNKEKDA